MRREKLLRAGGYAGFALAALLVGLYLTFPAAAVGQRLAHELGKRSAGSLSVSFGDISLYRLTGFEAEQVKLTTRGEKPAEILLDAVRVRLKLLRLLLFDLAASVEVELGDGEIEASLVAGDEEGAFAFELELDEVDLASPPLLPQLAGVPLGGTVSGKLESSYSRDPRKSEGKASLTIRDARLGPGEVQGFTLPSTALGQLDLAFDMRAGRLRLASFQQKGGDVLAMATAGLALRPDLGASSLDACFELRPTDSFIEKNPKMKAVVELAQVQLRKDGEGYLHVPLGGTLSAPKKRGGLCRRGGREE